MKGMLGFMNNFKLKDSQTFFRKDLKDKISFDDTSIPNSKDEEYKYFPLSKILDEDYYCDSDDENNEKKNLTNSNFVVNSGDTGKYFNILVNNSEVIFDNVFDGISIRKYTMENLPNEILNSFFDNQDFFSKVSLLISKNIFVIDIDKNFNSSLKIVYNFLNNTDKRKIFSSVFFLNIKQETLLNFVEYFFDKNSCDDIFFPLVYINIFEDAKVSYYKYTENNNIKILSKKSCNLYKNSKLKLVNINLSNNVLREDCSINLLEEEAGVDVSSSSFSKLKSFIDIFVSVNHKALKTTSSQDIKSVLYDESRSSFTGKIEVLKDSQKVKATQSSKSILLSKNSRSFARPWLKIFADDVECNHGATFGELDKNALFYLESRGINEDNAKKMLLEAFVVETLNKIEDKEFFNLCKTSLLQDS